MVALDSSSGSHCSSEKRRRSELLPTDELPMRRSLTLMSGATGRFSTGAITVYSIQYWWMVDGTDVTGS